MTQIRFIILLVCVCFVHGGCASSGGTPPKPVADQDTENAAAPVLPVVEVTAASLNVRQVPVSGAVVGSLKQGERVRAPNKASDGWVYIEAPSGLSGWVSAKYVRSVVPETTSPATSPQAAPSAVTDSGAAPEPNHAPSDGSRLAAIEPGMTSSQVVEIIGPPTREQNYITGKAFIPFYFGPDASRVDFKYAGVGRVVFSRNRYSGQLKVIRAEVDESETGY